MAEWGAENSAGPIGEGAVTVLEGTSFCISGANGDMTPERPHGFFHRDTRYICDWLLQVNERPIEPLEAIVVEPYRAMFVGRAERPDGVADSHLLVERKRTLGQGIHESITVRNHGRESVICRVQLTVSADFADLMEVKAGLKQAARMQSEQGHADSVVIVSDRPNRPGRIVIEAPGATYMRNQIRFEAVIPAQGTWTGTVLALPDEEMDLEEDADTRAQRMSGPFTEADDRLAEWRSQVPRVRVADRDVQRVLEQSQADLGSLRIFDPAHPGRAVLAAGSPWFMALFGRDSLLTSYMALPVDPTLALGTLQTLADKQGTRVDPRSEMQPGKILHEVRLGAHAGHLLGGPNGTSAYYGSVDATPLFVVLAGELTRWGFWPDVRSSVLPAVDRAMQWIEEYGDADGDGFVEYERAHDQSLLNQGWKDSWDGVNFADGRLASAPIALCEVQGYVYAAYIARALMAQEAGDTKVAAKWGARAAALKKAFNDRFWLEDQGYFAIALDHEKRPVDACASNMGHLLWSGIVDDDKAPFVAARLMSREMFSGWGVRTLATDMGAYNPASYHNGSVWPHDNAIIAGGLMRYGFTGEAIRITKGMFAAATAFGGRLPELFCGFDRDAYPVPVPYPTSCSPQAWAAAAPLHFLRMMLRFDPCLTHGGLWISPQVPPEFGEIDISNTLLARDRIALRVRGDTVELDGLPQGVELHREPRRPLEDLLNVHHPTA